MSVRRLSLHKVLAVCVCLFEVKQEVLCVLSAPNLDRTDATYKTLCGSILRLIWQTFAQEKLASLGLEHKNP